MGGKTRPDDDDPPVLYLAHVGTLSDGTAIDLQIDNITEYNYHNNYFNGLKEVEAGNFGVVNVKGPQTDGEPTFMQLRYTFINSLTTEPATLGRTYMTFYDFDGSNTLRECMQIRGSVSKVGVSPTTELQALHFNRTARENGEELEIDPALRGIMDALPPGSMFWDTHTEASPVYCSTETGIGADNPMNPHDIIDLQRDRSVLITFEDVSTFDVRFTLVGGKSTGRNFLFAGFSNVELPFCDPMASPPSPPPAKPSTPPPPPPQLPPHSPGDAGGGYAPPNLLSGFKVDVGTDGSSIAAILSHGDVDTHAMSDSLSVESTFSSLYLHEPDSTEGIAATVRGVEYARVSLTMPLAPPSSIQGVLRTVCRPN